MGCTFECAKGLEMGENSILNACCHIDSRGSIKIGKNVSISRGCKIITADHDMDNNMQGRNNAVNIDDYSWLGVDATILPGVHLAKGTVVGAKSLVAKSTEEYDFVGGVPAKYIRKRQPNIDYKTYHQRLFH